MIDIQAYSAHQSGNAILLEGALVSDEDRREENRRYQAEWYQRNKEKKNAVSRAWRAANLERAREITRDAEKRRAEKAALAAGREPGRVGRPQLLSDEERRARRKAKTEAYNAAHLEETREKARLREAAKRAGTFVSRALPRLTDEQRRLVNVAMSANRRARVRDNGGTFTRSELELVRVEQKGLCLFCGDPLGDAVPHVDHWIPIIRGGSSNIENIALLHEFCNLRKAAHMPSELGFPDDPALVRAALNDPTPVPEGDL